MAIWRNALKEHENKALDDIEAALARLEARKSEYLAKKKRLMNAAIRRNRRAVGKS